MLLLILQSQGGLLYGSGAGTSNATTTVEAIGASTVESVVSSSGLGATAFVGGAIASADGLAGATTTVSATGDVAGTTVSGTAAASGTSTVGASGASINASVGSAVGTTTVSSVGVAIASSIIAAAGVGSGVASGNALASRTVTASGTSSASAVGQTFGIAVGSSAGTTTVAGAGNALKPAVFASSGLAAASAVGDAFVGATANGDTVSASVSIIDGTATGAALVAGQTLARSSSIVPGVGSGAASVSGVSLPTSVTQITQSGVATGDATTAPQTVTGVSSVLPGSVSAERFGTASGAALGVSASIFETGFASGTQNPTVDGQIMLISSIISPGNAQGGFSVSVGGEAWIVLPSLIDGIGTGDAAVIGDTQTVTGTIIAGVATAEQEAVVDGIIFVLGSILQSGVAAQTSSERVNPPLSPVRTGAQPTLSTPRPATRNGLVVGPARGVTIKAARG